MKPDKREAARLLRHDQGLSINQICKQLGVSKSSVSLWVRDIELTVAQKEELNRQHYAYGSQAAGGAANKVKFRALREQYQQEGRQKTHKQDPLHIAGCMLYWGEGAKARNKLSLGNSDAALLTFYLKFLRESLKVADEEIVVSIVCYLGNGLTIEEIEAFWLNAFNLPRRCLNRSIVNVQPVSSQQKGRKLKYGVCNLTIHSTQLVQQVFGAIQEYTGIDKPEWLM